MDDEQEFHDLIAKYEAGDKKVLEQLHQPRWLGSIPLSDCIVTTKTMRDTYIEAFGKPQRGIFLCHRCDLYACSNLSHAFLGTNKQNHVDRAIKNRKLVASPDDRYLSVGCEYYGWVIKSKLHRKFYMVVHVACGKLTKINWNEGSFFYSPMTFRCEKCMPRKRPGRKRGTKNKRISPVSSHSSPKQKIATKYPCRRCREVAVIAVKQSHGCDLYCMKCATIEAEYWPNAIASNGGECRKLSEIIRIQI